MTMNAAVIGAGTMGIGIAYSLATHNIDTALVEPNSVRIAHVKQQLREVADDGIARGKLNGPESDAALAKISYFESVTDVPIGLNVIIESVPENLELKKRVLATAEARSPEILASNTSTLSIDDLSEGLQNPDRFAGAHFFNPVWAINLVEIIRGAATTDRTVELLEVLAAAIGKETAIVNDSPGFATSRLDLVASLEAIRMVESGVASAADIDRAMRVAYRHPVGPLRLSDIVGLDVRLDTAKQLAERLGPHFAPPALLIEMVGRGDLGQKTGQGFYSWT